MTFKETNYIYKKLNDGDSVLITFYNDFCIETRFFMWDFMYKKYEEIRDEKFDFPESYHETIEDVVKRIDFLIGQFNKKGFKHTFNYEELNKERDIER